MKVYFYTNTMLKLSLWTRVLVLFAYTAMMICVFGQMMSFAHPAVTGTVFIGALVVLAVRAWAIWKVTLYHQVIESFYPRHDQVDEIAAGCLLAGITEGLSAGRPFPGWRKMAIIKRIQDDLGLSTTDRYFQKILSKDMLSRLEENEDEHVRKDIGDD